MSLKKAITKIEDLIFSSTNDVTLKKFREYLLDNEICEEDDLNIYLNNPLLIKKNDIQIIGEGISQSTIDLDEELLLKVNFQYPDSIYPEFDYHVINKCSYNYHIIETTENMKKFGFNVPKTHFLRMQDKKIISVENSIDFLLAEDLRKNGEYKVQEYSKNLVKSTINAYYFEQICNGAINFLFDLYNLSKSVKNLNGKNKNYINNKFEIYEYVRLSHRIILNGHIKKEKDNPFEAIKHVFFITTNVYNVGSLYAGDLDHMFLLKNNLS